MAAGSIDLSNYENSGLLIRSYLPPRNFHVGHPRGCFDTAVLQLFPKPTVLDVQY